MKQMERCQETRQHRPGGHWRRDVQPVFFICTPSGQHARSVPGHRDTEPETMKMIQPQMSIVPRLRNLKLEEMKI